MKWIISRYNNDLSYLPRYTDDCVLYDRSDEEISTLPDYPFSEAYGVLNVGTDIYDKFTYIIDHYENLPDVAVYTKANIFKYISKPEFELVKDNRVFTPLLTKNHEEKPGVSFYKDGIYWEINNYWYLGAHPVQHDIGALVELLGIWNMKYVPFAPGSNYILTKEDILQHPKELYEELRSYLELDRYPGEAMIIERGLYTLWKSPLIQKEKIVIL